MRRRYLLPIVLILGTLWRPSVDAQEQRPANCAVSATLIAASRRGLVPDLHGRAPVVNGALYIKIRFGLGLFIKDSLAFRQGVTPTEVVASLFEKYGLELEAANSLNTSLAVPPGHKAWRLAGFASRSYRFGLLFAQDELSRIVAVSYAKPLHPRKVAAFLSTLPEIEYAEPIFVPEILGPSEPNDPRLSEQKQIDFVNAGEAWKIWPGDSSVVIGVIDAGITARHEDLWDNIAVNWGEAGLDNEGKNKSTNRIDDDGNGYVDDWKGVNLTYQSDGTPPDSTGNGEHGTQVSGYVGATTDNGRGIAGIANQCRFFPVKAAHHGSTSLIAGYEGIIYCAQQGFKVINCSWGSTTFSQAEQDIIDNVIRAYNVTIVAAGGNNAEYNLFYPAGYRGVLGVGGVNDLSQFITTWGEHIDVTATAGLTTSGLYNYFDLPTATSYTTPVVSGIVALVRSRWPELDARQAATHVRLSSINIDQLNLGKEGLIGNGRVDATIAISTDPFSHPGIVIDSVWALDEGGQPQDQFVVGEKGQLMIRLSNLLGDAKNVHVHLSRYTGDSSAVYFDPAPLDIGDISSGQSWTTTEGVPFEIRSPSDGLTKVRVDIVADNYQDYAYEVLQIYRPYTVYQNSRIKWTLTDRGRIGFDRLEFGQFGEGVTIDGRSHLYEGGIIVAESREKVLDNIRSDAPDDQNNDFSVIAVPSPNNDSLLSLTDMDAEESLRVGVEIEAQIRFVDTVADAVGFEICVTNTSNERIDSLRVGFFADWDLDRIDVGQTVELGEESLPGVATYGIVSNPGGSQLVVGVIEPAESTPFFAIRNNGDPVRITDDFNKDEKWMILANGIGNSSAGPGDISMVIGKVLAGLEADAKDTIRFVVGYSPSSAEDAVDAMIQYVHARTSSLRDRRENQDDHLTVQPNPASDYVEVQLSGPHSPNGTIVLYNSIGKKVRTASPNADIIARNVRSLISVLGLPSGIYYVTYTAENIKLTAPLLILR